MRIVAQTLKDGSVRILDAPPPLLGPGQVRVRTLFSAISPGTEGNKIVTGRKSLIGKAKAKPDQVRQVLQMYRQLGLKHTVQKVRDKLEGAQPLGYSLSGVVLEVAEDVDRFRPGQRVACGGGGYAVHADEVVVPVNLVAGVPDGVASDDAAFATLGSIALEGVRLAAPTIGESVVVIGLGLVGLFASQILRANGCRVFGADISSAAVDRAIAGGHVDAARRLGADPVEAAIAEFTRGRGADAVLICAATSSNEPVILAGRISRQRGRVVVVGAVGMDVPRQDYYEKEIQFSVSCSYGPGRYDPSYEEGGLDYPFGFVRWTEGRNMEAILDLVDRGALKPSSLVTHRYPFDRAVEAYEMLTQPGQDYCGILLEYGEAAPDRGKNDRVFLAPNLVTPGRIRVGFAGCGSFAQTFLLPPLRNDPRTSLSAIFTRSGLTAADVGKRHGFREAVASAAAVIDNDEVDAVVIATRHDQHGPLTLAALRAGKHTFVEKPLCLDEEDLRAIARMVSKLSESDQLPVLQVGFNRRFSEAATHAKDHLRGSDSPLSIIYRVNAGHVSPAHWTQNPDEGGGRILGEVCHFVDLMQFLTESNPVAVQAICIETTNAEIVAEDNVSISLRFEDGSIGSILYFSEGARSMPKERVEIAGGGLSATIDDFRRVTLYSSRGEKTRRCRGKGHAEEVRAFLDGIEQGRAPIPVQSLIATTAATLRARAALKSGKTENIPPWSAWCDWENA